MTNNTQNSIPTTADLQNQLLGTNHLICNGFDSIHNHLANSFAKSRKKLLGCNITQNPDSQLFFLKRYDNNIGESYPLFVLHHGKFDIYQLVVKDFEFSCNYFIIHFLDTREIIIGDINKLSANYLYELFIMNGFFFNQEIKKSQLLPALQEYWIPKIVNTQNVIDFSGLAGWDRKIFQHAGNALVSYNFKSLPVHQNNFDILPLESTTFDVYKHRFENCRDIQNKFMLSHFVFVSMLSSLFQTYISAVDFSINIIATEHISLEQISQLFKVFSRENLSMISYEMTQKELEKNISITKDDVLLMDLRLISNTDYYRRHLRDRRFEHVKSLLSGRKTLPNQTSAMMNAGLITIADEMIPKASVYNIIVDDDVLSVLAPETGNQKFKEEKILERILSQFVNFIEEQKNEFSLIFNQKCISKTHRGQILEITNKLLQRFWKKYGVDFNTSFGFNDAIDFDNFFGIEEELLNEDVDIFLKKISDEFSNHAIVPKRSMDANENSIFFDDVYVYFPLELLESICSTCGITSYRNYLLKLRASNSMSCSQDRLVKHIVVNHKTLACYVLHRSLFEKPGELSISHLGKEKKLC